MHASVVLAQSAAQPEPSPSPPALSGENSQEEVEEEEKPPRLRLPEGSVAPARSSPSSTASSKTESNPMQREGQPPSDPTIAPWTT
ncbi:MAG: hypothetical protein N2515_11030, partial [Deltaproteobacteria bacterium]|nr:hypothetical protein [Deltaproteobacteria bacterium]